MTDRAVIGMLRLGSGQSGDVVVRRIVDDDRGEAVVAVVAGLAPVREGERSKRYQHEGRNQPCARPQPTQHAFTVETRGSCCQTRCAGAISALRWPATVQEPWPVHEVTVFTRRRGVNEDERRAADAAREAGLTGRTGGADTSR